MIWTIPFACLLGALSPLCTIGTVPVLLALIRRGLPLPVALAFLGGSSMTNPQLFLLTAGTLGWPLALFQWIASLGAGITLGSIAAICERRGWRLQAPLPLDPPCPARGAQEHETRRFFPEFVAQLDRVAVVLAIGVVLGSIFQVYLPSDLVGRVAGRFPALSVVFGALLSAPFYVCGGGALPAMAALVEKGLPAGAALAFFVAGPATRVQSLAAVAVLVRPRLVVIYVAVVLAWASLLGLALNAIYAR